MPHGYCFLWVPEILWTHIISDFTIALAYFLISLTLFYLIFKRRSIPFSWVFVLFSLFIFLCGLTHLVSLLTIWYPFYGLEAAVKLITAAVSIATAFMLFPLIPKLLALFNRYVSDIEKSNEKK